MWKKGSWQQNNTQIMLPTYSWVLLHHDYPKAPLSSLPKVIGHGGTDSPAAKHKHVTLLRPRTLLFTLHCPITFVYSRYFTRTCKRWGKRGGRLACANQTLGSKPRFQFDSSVKWSARSHQHARNNAMIQWHCCLRESWGVQRIPSVCAD